MNSQLLLGKPKVLTFILLFFLNYHVLNATSACELVTERFASLEDGTVEDNRVTGWSIDASSVPNALYFAVKSHRFHAEELEGEGVWVSKEMNVSGYPNFQVGVKITAEGDLRSNEYVKIYYKLDGGQEILYEERTGNFGTIDFKSPELNAQTVQIIVRLYNYDKDSYAKSVYYIEEYRIFSDVEGCVLEANPWVEEKITCSSYSVTLIPGLNSESNINYYWSGPDGFTSNEKNPVVSYPGIYSLTADIPASSSSASGSVRVEIDTAAPDVTISVNGTLECSSPNVQISVISPTDGLSNNWIGPDDFNSEQAIDTVQLPGSYTITITNPLNGCYITETVFVEEATSAPDVAVNKSGDLTCSISSVTLQGSSSTPGLTYQWFGPNSFTSDQQNVEVSAPGNYTLTVEDPVTFCTASETITVIQSDVLPGATIETSGQFNCITNSVTLMGLSGSLDVSYTWIGPNDLNLTAQNIEISEPGEYYLIVVSNSTGCQSEASILLDMDAIKPGVSANTSGLLDCENPTISLLGNSNITPVNFYWTGNNGFTSYEQNPEVNQPGAYLLTVTNPLNGCFSTAGVTVEQSETVPGAYAQVSGIITCSNSSVILDGSSDITNVSFEWTGPDGFSSTSQTVDVTVAGNYNLTVVNLDNSCSSTISVIVDQNLASPDVYASVDGDLTCQTSVTLLGSSTTENISYYWAGPGGFSSTEQNPTANLPGTYYLTVTDPQNGCTGESSVEVDVGEISVDEFWTEDFALANGTTVDEGSTAWTLQNTGSGIFSVQENEFKASFESGNEGIWLSEIIDISSRSNVVISVDLRSETASTNDYFEDSDYISVYYKLDNGSEILMFEDFSGLNSTSNTSESLTANSGYINAGTIQIIIKARNSHNTERYYFDNVVLAGSPVSIGLEVDASVDGELNCINNSVSLIGSANISDVSYNWTGPDGFSSTNQNPLITDPGVYVLTITNSAGCSATDLVNVVQDITNPEISSGVSGSLSCETNSVSLAASSSSMGVSYYWSGPDGFASDIQNPVVTVPGSYSLTITDNLNGCSSSEVVQVVSSAGIIDSLWFEDFSLSNGTSVDNGATSWSTITPPGTFTVNNNKFIVSGTGIVSEGVWMSGLIDISNQTNVSVSIDVSSSGVPMNSTGSYTDYLNFYYRIDEGTEVFFAEKIGDIIPATSVTISDLSGSNLQVIIKARASSDDEFYSIDNILITENTFLTAHASVSGVLGCTVQSVTLNGTSNQNNVTYLWEGPGGFISTVQNSIVTDMGIYSLTVTNPENGCSAQDTVSVFLDNTEPGAYASVDAAITCSDSSVTLLGNSDMSGVKYSWSGPQEFSSTEQNPAINLPGTYVLVVDNSLNGCTSSASISVEQDKNIPDISATVSGSITCITESVTLTGSSSVSSVSYGWTGPDGYISSEQAPIVSVPGTYFLTVRDQNNGCANAQSIEVISNTGATGTVWYEDFPHANSTVIDEGITSWSTSNEEGTFKVYNNEFLATNNSTTGQGVWTSGLINISGKVNVSISVDVRSAVDDGAVMNDDGIYMDYMRFYYQVDGGEEVLFAEKLGAINNNIIYASSLSIDGLKGTDLRIIAKVRATGDDEYYYFDNVRVIGGGQIDAYATASGLLTCNDSTVTLQGSSGVQGVKFSWIGPDSFFSDEQNPEVSIPGNYTLTVTDQSNGCFSDFTLEVGQDINEPGVSAIVNDQLSCSVASVVLSGSSTTNDVIFEWTGPNGFTSSNQNPDVNTIGTYTLSVTNPINGCENATTLDVTSAPPGPATTIWLEDFALDNGTTVDNGATSWSIQNSGSGIYSVQDNEFKTSFESGNVGTWLSAPIDISAKSNVVVSVDLKSETASSSDYFESDDYIGVYYILDDGSEQLIFEDFAGLGETVNSLASTSVTSGYLNGSSLQIIIKTRNSHNTERYYFDNVEVTGTDQIVGTITASANGSITCLDENVQLTALVDNPSASYYWIDPENNIIIQQNPVVTQPGNYTAMVTVGGCQAAKTIEVIGSTIVPDLSVSGDHLACSIDIPVVIEAVSSNKNLSYSWVGPAGFTSVQKNPSILIAGTYTVSVTDQINLCQNSASFEVQYGTLLWNEDFNDLENGTIEDLGNSAWTLDTSMIHSVDLSYYSSESGIPYYFEVRENKLEAKSTRGEVVWTSAPIDVSGANDVFVRMDISGEGTLNDTINCGADCFDYDYVEISYIIDGNQEYSFENFGNMHGSLALIPLKASSQIPASNSVQIQLKVYNTGNNEKFFFDNIQVLALGEGGGAVSATAEGKITCKDSLVTLLASPNIVGNDYKWIGPDGFISYDPETQTDRSGLYTLMVSGNTGCVTSDTVTVEVMSDTITPDVILNSTGKITCQNNTITLQGSSNSQNVLLTWTGPDYFNSVEENIEISVSGTYYLFVDSENSGCIGSDSIIVDVDTLSPVSSISSSGNLNCVNDEILLSAIVSTSHVNYVWEGPNNFKDAAKVVHVTQDGMYILEVTDTTNDCRSISDFLVERDTLAPEVSATSNGQLDCETFFVRLEANSPMSGISYQWSGPLGYVSSQQNPVTTIAGEYTVEARNPMNGCKSMATHPVDADINPPSGVIADVSGIINCNNLSVNLIASSDVDEASYLWEGPHNFNSTQANPEVTEPGNYLLTVTDPTNHCKTTASVLVEKDQEKDWNVVTTVSGILTCIDTIVTVSASSTIDNAEYEWASPNSLSSSQQQVEVSVPGEYFLTVSQTATGCMYYDTVTVEQNIDKPSIISVSVSDSIDCTDTPVILSVSSLESDVSYVWEGPYGFFYNEQITETVIPGEYSITLTNPINGCTSTEQTAVTKQECD